MSIAALSGSSPAPLEIERSTSSFHSARVADSITSVRSVLSRWDPHSSLPASFLRATTHLHSYLLHLSASRSAPHELVPTNFLLQSAMTHLDRQLKNHLLSITDAHPTPHAISTIRSIVDTMISTGYGEECLTTYQAIRRSAVASQLTQLSFDLSAYPPKKLRKIKWDSLEIMIKLWSDATPTAFQSIFSEERYLSDAIFGSSPESVRNAVFESIVGEIATKFLSFPELVIMRVKRLPEKLFRLLDIYVVLSHTLPEIESVFESLPASEAQQRAISSLTKLSDAVQKTLVGIEKAIQKNRVKPHITAPDGGILPLTRYMMNYMISLSDYEPCLGAIVHNMAPLYNSSSFQQSDDNPHNSPVSIWFARLLRVLVRKLESKAESYRDKSLSYLFLTNNVNYMIRKVESSLLNNILGDDWAAAHKSTVRRYVEGHLRSGWAHVHAALPVKDKEALEKIERFEMIFRKVAKERNAWIVVDVEKRDEMRLLVEAMVVPPYHRWYRAYQRNGSGHGTVRFSPHDVAKQIWMLYEGSNSGSGSGSAEVRHYLGQRGRAVDIKTGHEKDDEEAQSAKLSLPDWTKSYDTRHDGELSFRYQIKEEDN